MCCPSLSEITIDDRPSVVTAFIFAGSPELVEIVRGTLRSARANTGAIRLKKLQLHLEYYVEELWNQTSQLHEAFMGMRQW